MPYTHIAILTTRLASAHTDENPFRLDIANNIFNPMPRSKRDTEVTSIGEYASKDSILANIDMHVMTNHRRYLTRVKPNQLTRL